VLLRDGQHYDALHADRTADIPLWVEEARRAGGHVLEVACGTGRITIPLAQSGLEVVGLDISDSMLGRAREKAAGAGVEIEWICADCRDFHLGRTFGLIFIAFNSMLHLHERTDLERFLACVREHLRPGGRFALDVFNPSVERLARPPSPWSTAFRYTDPDGGGEVVIEERSQYDAARQIVELTWRWVRGGMTLCEEELALRCLFPQELDALLHYNGFEVVERWGSHDRRPFESGSPNQIVVCCARP
jgi:SAM-dependent methyltransferase